MLPLLAPLLTPVVAAALVAGTGPTPAGAAPSSASVALAATRAAPWRPPLDGPLLRAFDPPERPWLPGHRGVDLGAAPGSPVRAAGAGTVVFAAVLAGRGVVVVEHASGLRTTYEPVEAVVSAGDPVSAGDLLGVVGTGSVHCGRAPTCLHWGLRRGRAYLDPWLLLHRGRPILLPAGRDGP